MDQVKLLYHVWHTQTLEKRGGRQVAERGTLGVHCTRVGDKQEATNDSFPHYPVQKRPQ